MMDARQIDAMLAPISPERPCGEDLAFSPEMDAISRAREADDPSLEQGAWSAPLKEADWPLVASRSAALLATRSKDLRLAVWLADASARTGGLAQLAGALVVLAGLCQRYWDQLYPLADEDGQEQRIGNLAWIAARVTQLVPTLPPDGAAACLDAVTTLERIIDVRLGADAPSFSAARAALAALVGPPLRACAAPPPAPAMDNPAGSRAEALAQLRSVAEFFRRTEPHSPVAYLADKAARWGEQPLHVWLRGVVQDDAVYGQLEQLLGVGGKG